MIVLGIETSCDETSVGIIREDGLILSNVVYSQAKKHALFGGIVPEVASREHVKAIGWVYQKALEEAGKNLKDIDLLAVTEGPGLQGPLLVGISFAKGLSSGLGIPIIGVNHLEAHIYSPLLENQNFTPPYLSLLISGGHAILVYVEEFFKYNVLGTTRDDAAGECFDKIARLLNLNYPSGPAIEESALNVKLSDYKLPSPLKGDKTLDFSFSGLKTAVYYLLEDLKERNLHIKTEHLAHAAQEAVFGSIMDRLERAVYLTGAKKLSVVGGVASNKKLRSYLENFALHKDIKLNLPSIELCTDNGAMVAYAGLLSYRMGLGEEKILDARPNLSL